MDDHRAPVLEVPSGRVVWLFGDLHLGDGGINDGFGRHDEIFSAVLSSCADRCDTVVFMGDVLDLPQG